MCLGIPGKIVELHGDTGLTMGVVDFGGVRREVDHGPRLASGGRGRGRYAR